MEAAGAAAAQKVNAGLKDWEYLEQNCCSKQLWCVPVQSGSLPSDSTANENDTVCHGNNCARDIYSLVPTCINCFSLLSWAVSCPWQWTEFQRPHVFMDSVYRQLTIVKLLYLLLWSRCISIFEPLIGSLKVVCVSPWNAGSFLGNWKNFLCSFCQRVWELMFDILSNSPEYQRHMPWEWILILFLMVTAVLFLFFLA